VRTPEEINGGKTVLVAEPDFIIPAWMLPNATVVEETPGAEVIVPGAVGEELATSDPPFRFKTLSVFEVRKVKFVACVLATALRDGNGALVFHVVALALSVKLPPIVGVAQP
jgi:hypothetical protein